MDDRSSRNGGTLDGIVGMGVREFAVGQRVSVDGEVFVIKGFDSEGRPVLERPSTQISSNKKDIYKVRKSALRSMDSSSPDWVSRQQRRERARQNKKRMMRQLRRKQ